MTSAIKLDVKNNRKTHLGHTGAIEAIEAIKGHTGAVGDYQEPSWAIGGHRGPF